MCNRREGCFRQIELHTIDQAWFGLESQIRPGIAQTRNPDMFRVVPYSFARCI